MQVQIVQKINEPQRAIRVLTLQRSNTSSNSLHFLPLSLRATVSIDLLLILQRVKRKASSMLQNVFAFSIDKIKLSANGDRMHIQKQHPKFHLWWGKECDNCKILNINIATSLIIWIKLNDLHKGWGWNIINNLKKVQRFWCCTTFAWCLKRQKRNCYLFADQSEKELLRGMKIQFNDNFIRSKDLF